MQINVKVQVPVLNGRNTRIRWAINELERALENEDPKLNARSGGGEDPDTNGDFSFPMYETEHETMVARFQVAMDDVSYLDTDADGGFEEDFIWRTVWFKMSVDDNMELARTSWVQRHWERKGFMKGNFVVVPTAAAAQTSGQGTGIYF